MKIVLAVIDGFGIGEAKDAYKYQDVGSNTLLHISDGINIPNLIKLGLSSIDNVDCLPKISFTAQIARLAEKSAGKDTTTGHFEISGVPTLKPYPTFPNGFPEDIVKKLEIGFKSKILGNKVASGTVIINELGDEHIKTKAPIVYTSADSVLQIAAHEEVVPIKDLYNLCKIAREIMVPPNNVARIIARPFLGKTGGYFRTENRRDFGLVPPKPTLLDLLNKKGFDVVGVGKIHDIFSGRGLTDHISAHNNNESIDGIIKALKTDINGLIFANLIDTDMLYGHRNDVPGYRASIENIDRRLPEIISLLKEEDVLIITSDHGCDPYTESTDHSREDVPLLIYGKNLASKNLGTICGFDYISKRILEFLI